MGVFDGDWRGDREKCRGIVEGNVGVFDGVITERNVGGILEGNVGVFDGEVTERNVGVL